MGKEFLPSQTHTYASRKTLRYSNGTIHIIPGKNNVASNVGALVIDIAEKTYRKSS